MKEKYLLRVAVILTCTKPIRTTHCRLSRLTRIPFRLSFTVPYLQSTYYNVPLLQIFRARRISLSAMITHISTVAVPYRTVSRSMRLPFCEGEFWSKFILYTTDFAVDPFIMSIFILNEMNIGYALKASFFRWNTKWSNVLWELNKKKTMYNLCTGLFSLASMSAAEVNFCTAALENILLFDTLSML